MCESVSSAAGGDLHCDFVDDRGVSLVPSFLSQTPLVLL